MSGPRPHLPVVELWPGELSVVAKPALVVTVLGSCVAVTFFHRSLGLGAACHALLPEAAARGGDADPDPFRYVEPSVRHMAETFRRRGAAPEETEVKVFGGGDVLLTRKPGRGATVGARNVSAAFEVLSAEGYRVAASDVGGPRGRKIYFDTTDGTVLLKRLSRALERDRPEARGSRSLV